MNLSRFAVSIMASSMPGRDFEKELVSLVDMKKIHQAINNNNGELAWKNFQIIKPFIARYTQIGADLPLTAATLGAFEFFVSKGLDHWFKEDPMQHWIKLASYPGMGWENFIAQKVVPEMLETFTTNTPELLKK